MRIGLFLAYWPWFSPEEQVELAQLADELGLDSVWISEAWGQDAVSVLGLLAGKTERVALGSGLMQIPARQPAATAMAAATLDVLSGGRFRLGLGVSGPQVSEGWYGVPFRRPLRRTREYVEIVRKVLAREAPLEHAGAGVDAAAAATVWASRSSCWPSRCQERIPIYLGAIGPKAVEQVGEIADGWLPFLLNPREPDLLLDPLRAGVEKAGPLAGGDRHRAGGAGRRSTRTSTRRATSSRPWLAFYLGAMGAKEKNFYVGRRRSATATATRPARCQERVPGRRPDGRRGRRHRRADRRRLHRDHPGRPGRQAGRLRGRRRHDPGGGPRRRPRRRPCAPLAEAVGERVA